MNDSSESRPEAVRVSPTYVVGTDMAPYFSARSLFSYISMNSAETRSGFSMAAEAA
jgi:hypothetical protein